MTNRPSFLKRLRASDVIFAACVSIVIGIYCEVFREFLGSVFGGTELYLLVGKAGASTVLYVILFFAIALAIIALAVRFGKKLGEFCFKWRYVIAVALLIVLVAFQISGSSLGLWGTTLSGKSFSELDGLLFGVPRSIRSDELIVYTPQAFSQFYTGYAAVSDIIRGVPTDVTMIYAQPSWALATLFRPFLWGYLIAGSQIGLSFFWCARLITLFMVSFEFGRFITKDRRVLALAYAMLVSFAPIVQWWFAINGTAELLIFGQLLVLSFSAWLKADTVPKCIVLSLAFAYCAGCFIMVIYPAWQVGLGYGIAALLIAVLISARKNKQPASLHVAARVLVLFGFMALLAAVLAIVLVSSWDVIQTVTHTEFPGQRFETGGGLASSLFNYVAAWFAPAIQHAGALPNEPEFASFLTLFPLGILLGIYSLRHARDPFIICLLIADIILLAYGCFGFPAWLAKITLLSHVETWRIDMCVGFIETVLLIRSCCIIAESKPENSSETINAKNDAIYAGAAIAFALCATLLCYLVFHLELNTSKVMLLLSFLFTSCAVFAFLRSCRHTRFDGCVLAIASVILVTGLCVNPIQQGSSELTDSQLSSDVKQVISESDSAANLWIADNALFSQAAIASGAPTLTSVATYPSLETWEKIDPNGDFKAVYNRYAHIQVEPTQDKTSFTLVQDDLFTVNLNADDAQRLGATYWISSTDLTQYNTDKTVFTQVAPGNDQYSIYKVSAK